MGSQRWAKPFVRTVWTSYGSQKCQSLAQTCLNGINTVDVSLPLGLISHPCVPCSDLHGSHCHSRQFTGPAKLVLEKQTSQPSLVMALCMCSVQV